MVLSGSAPHSPGGIFTLRPLNMFDAFFRAEIVIGAIVAACGMLVWRSASRKLSLANYVIVSSCVAVLLPCVSKLSEWVYFIDHRRGFLTLNDLEVGVIEITIPGLYLGFRYLVGRQYVHARAVSQIHAIQPIRQIVPTPIAPSPLMGVWLPVSGTRVPQKLAHWLAGVRGCRLHRPGGQTQIAVCREGRP